MSPEKPNQNPTEGFGAMMSVWAQIQVLGRNDSEIHTGQQIIKKVETGELTPAEGYSAMVALLNSKQEH